MEDLKYKYENFRKCYKALGKVIPLQENLDTHVSDDPMTLALTAAVVKHFELTYETGWKFLKEYLFVTYNRDVISPKAVFRACEEVHLFQQSMLNDLITLADARNETTHIYNQLLAQEVCNSIEKHYQVFGKILESIQLPLE